MNIFVHTLCQEFSMLKSDDDCNIHALPLDSKNNPQRTHKKMDIVAINFSTLLAYPLPHTCLIELELYPTSKFYVTRFIIFFLI